MPEREFKTKPRRAEVQGVSSFFFQIKNVLLNDYQMIRVFM